MPDIPVNVHASPGGPWLEVLPGPVVLASEADALDLVALCGEHGADRVLLPAGSLAEAFYDLRTGLAGAVLLKFTNYGIRAAAVIPPEKVGSGRFAEMVLETNRRPDFRVYSDRDSAAAWLAGLGPGRPLF